MCPAERAPCRRPAAPVSRQFRAQETGKFLLQARLVLAVLRPAAPLLAPLVPLRSPAPSASVAVRRSLAALRAARLPAGAKEREAPPWWFRSSVQ